MQLQIRKTQKESLNSLLTIKGFLCDPGAIQTHDLQNRNLTLYSLSYGAILSKCGDKSIKNLLIFLMILPFFIVLKHSFYIAIPIIG